MFNGFILFPNSLVTLNWQWPKDGPGWAITLKLPAQDLKLIDLHGLIKKHPLVFWIADPEN